MKKQIVLSSMAITSVTALFFNACKPKDNVVDLEADKVAFQSHLALNKSNPASTSLAVALGGIVNGPNGSYIKFLPNCFQDASGNNVTGNVIITYLDASKPGDMFYNKLLPISGSQNLFSGGEYVVTATQNGNAVFLKPGMTTDAIFFDNNKNVNGMTFFKGIPVEKDPNTVVNWVNKFDSLSNVIVFNGDSIDISSDSLGMCNADRFITSPVYVSCGLNITGATVSKNSFSGMCIYKDYNGYWPLDISETTGEVSGSHIPAGILVHYVVFGVYNNKFYRGVVKDISTTDLANYNIVLEEAEPNTYKAWLNAL